MNAAMTRRPRHRHHDHEGQDSNSSVDFAVDGAFRKAATDDLWTLTGAAFGSVTTSQFNKYLLLLDSSGTASVVACTPSTQRGRGRHSRPARHARRQEPHRRAHDRDGQRRLHARHDRARRGRRHGDVPDGIDKNMLKLLTDESSASSRRERP
jgi:hypothetical protein